MPDKHEVGGSTPLEPTKQCNSVARQKGHWKLNKKENEQIILRFQKKS